MGNVMMGQLEELEDKLERLKSERADVIICLANAEDAVNCLPLNSSEWRLWYRAQLAYENRLEALDTDISWLESGVEEERGGR
jgi:hypothetical protein